MDNEKILKEYPTLKLIAKLCIPTVIITLIMVIYNMADIFFVSKTNNVNMVNAVSVCMPLFTIIQAFGTLIGSGGSTAISLYLGKKENKKIKNVTSFCFYFSIFLGIILMIVLNVFAKDIVKLAGASDEYINYAITYLRIIGTCSPILLFSNSFVNIIRADGSATKSMIANLLGTITNIILDPILILIFNQGVAGAAIATVLGNFVTLIYLILYIRKNNNLFSLKIKDLKLNKEISLNTLNYGLPLSIGTLLMSFSYVVMNNLLVNYNSNATGAFGICRVIMLLGTMIHMGVCMGIGPAISYNYGNKDYKRTKDITIKTGIITVIFGATISILIIGFRSYIFKLFISNDEILYYANKLIIGCMATMSIYGMFQLASVFLQSTEKALQGTIVTLLRQGIILMPSMLILNKLFGFTGLLFAFPITDIIATIIGLILCIKRYNILQFNDLIDK